MSGLADKSLTFFSGRSVKNFLLHRILFLIRNAGIHNQGSCVPVVQKSAIHSIAKRREEEVSYPWNSGTLSLFSESTGNRFDKGPAAAAQPDLD
jgi:hypothetical protein